MAIQFYKLRVSKVQRETKEAVSVSFDIPDALLSEFKYKAGQYLTLRFYFNGEDVRRSYSLSSAPNIDNEITVTVKEVTGGKASPYINNFLKVGDMIDVMPPLGNFTPNLETQKAKHYVLLGGGSGITPLISIMKTVLAEDSRSKVTLLYANWNESSIIFDVKLNEIIAKYSDRAKRIDVLTEPSSAWTGLAGTLNNVRVAEILNQNISEEVKVAEYYICGPTGLMAEFKAAADLLANNNNQIHLESFTASVAIKTEEQRKAESSGDENSVKIIIYGEERDVVVKPGHTILMAAIKAGIDPPFSCQIGACSTCRAKVISGEVEMEDDSALSEDEIEEGYILTCTAHPKSAGVVIDYDDY